MDLTITSCTSKSRGPSKERKNVAATEKQLESMVYRLTQERGRRPFLTLRLENATEKTKENAPPLVKQIWSFLEEQLEVAEKREMTVARFVTAANEVTIGGFWREHAKGELKTRRDYEILEFLSPCWGKEFMAGVFGAKETIFGAFVQEILSMPISLLLALYLVYPRYLFNMGPNMEMTSNMEMILLSAEGREKNTFDGNRNMFLGTLDEDAWREFLSDFNREMDGEITMDDFKEKLWDTVVKFAEPVLMRTGLEEKARGELLSKMV